ncbi:hypothetical protein MASR2M18_06810 [Ignavibacteria bacterium]|nr:hypothetical protein [Bacteroidota bacterium]MCZ2131698.1 hypothetical protein [Bacteroidota bacterium]
MQKYNADMLALIGRIEQITDKIASVFEEKSRLNDGEIDTVNELYKQRGNLIAELNEQFYERKEGARPQNEDFFAIFDRIQHKNNDLNVKIQKMTADASERLRDLTKQRALILYSQQP